MADHVTTRVVGEFTGEKGDQLIALYGTFPDEPAANKFIDVALLIHTFSEFQVMEVTDPKDLLDEGKEIVDAGK